MKVWVENPFDNLPAEGFRPQRFWLMSRAFARAGHEVVLWTSAFNHTTKAERKIEGGETRNGFEFVLVPAPPYRTNVSLVRVWSHRVYARNWERMARARAAVSGKPDVIIVSAPPLSTGDVALRLAREWGARLVVDIMDDWPGTFYRLLPRPLRGLGPLAFGAMHRAAKRLYAAADLVTGVADRYADLVPDRPFARFYHGIDLDGTAASGGTLGNAVALRVAYAGNLGRTYDLTTAIQAVARIPEATLTVAGEGEQSEALAALAARLIPERFAYRGYLAGAELDEMLANCDVGLVPMVSESCVGVPYKLADYARAGLAVVSSLGGESGALLARYGAGETYRGGDEGDLVRVLGSLLPRLKALKAGSRRLAEAEFDASRIYAAYVKRVSSLAGCPRPENGQARSGLITNRERRRLTADARKG